MGRMIRRTVAGVSFAALAAALTLPGAVAASAPAGHTSTPAQTGGAPASTVPAGFRGNSISWLTPKQGWVMGAAACGTKTCTDVISTTDAGHSWSMIGKIKAPISTAGEPTDPGVTDVRFATATVGWAFGPKLFATSDGGATWAKMAIPGSGKQVLSLATNSTGAYAVVSGCRYAMGVCKQPLTFWQTTLTSGVWTQIQLNLPVDITADVAAFGSTVYVLDPLAGDGGTDLLYASTDGTHFTARPIPCDNTMEVSLIQVVPTSATNVALLCDAPIGFGQAFKSVYRSSDTGQTDRFAGQLPMLGIQAQLAASPSGNLAVASYSDGSFIYINDTHKKTWTMVLGLSGGAAWNDISYTTNKDAWVMYAPAGFFNGAGQLTVTHDSGQHWTVAPY